MSTSIMVHDIVDITIEKSALPAEPDDTLRYVVFSLRDYNGHVTKITAFIDGSELAITEI